MYKCDNCGKNTDTKEKQNKIYVFQDREYKNIKEVIDPKTRRRKEEVFTTQGKEIVAELNYCNDCYNECNGELTDGENTQRKRRRNQSIKGRNSQIERRSEINDSGRRRVS